MIVPDYWAEARRQHREGRRQITVRRFGWSETSQSEAQAMAESRVEAALPRVVSGQKLPRRERKVPYNGAEGMPIREEVLARHGDVVITRNSYGAKCLNTPDVLFADIDFEPVGSFKAKFQLFVVLAVVAGIIGFLIHSVRVAVLFVILAVFIVGPIVNFFARLRLRKQGGPEHLPRTKIHQFLARNQAWNLRLYRTPAGMRLVATHQLFSPGDAAVQDFLNAIGADQVYTLMCLRQGCFRARLTAKPWRIGISAHMKPHPGVWPIRPERLGDRMKWITAYEAKARNFASCTFIESLGSGVIHPKVATIVELHDRESKATASGIPIA